VDQLESERSQDNVNVTLGKRRVAQDCLLGKIIPCQLCGAGLDIRIAKTGKPYVICSDCGTQFFVRREMGIKRLQALLNSQVLISGGGTKGDSSIVLFNRLQQLRVQKRDFEGKQGVMFHDPDLTNAIRAVDNEIKQVQGELAKLGGKKSEKSK
jgi:hypothetical protein